MNRPSNWLPFPFLVLLTGIGCGPSKLDQRITSLEESVASVQRDQALAVSRLDESNRLNQTVYLLQDRVEQIALDMERIQSGAPEPAPELNFDQPEEEPKSEPKAESKPPVRPAVKAAPAAAPKKAPAADVVSTDDPVTLYRKAYDLLAAGKFAEAAPLFQHLVTEFPGHDLADNAQYWLGESDYAQKNYAQALSGFQKVVDNFPSGNKVPDAMLKIAFTYQHLGDKIKARETLQKIIKEFPWSDPAKKAKERLQSLG